MMDTWDITMDLVVMVGRLPVGVGMLCRPLGRISEWEERRFLANAKMFSPAEQKQRGCPTRMNAPWLKAIVQDTLTLALTENFLDRLGEQWQWGHYCCHKLSNRSRDKQTANTASNVMQSGFFCPPSLTMKHGKNYSHSKGQFWGGKPKGDKPYRKLTITTEGTTCVIGNLSPMMMISPSSILVRFAQITIVWESFLPCLDALASKLSIVNEHCNSVTWDPGFCEYINFKLLKFYLNLTKGYLICWCGAKLILFKVTWRDFIF